jgi:2-phosphosulpholactate phosphatase
MSFQSARVALAVFCRHERMAALQEKRSVEVCFSPALFKDVLTTGDFIVVLVDILRATTTICTAVANGVEAIIPVASHEEARQLKSEGFLVATEKDGVQLDFADFGNSALSFTRDAIGGKTLVYCTTNGTRALELAKSASGIVIGAFINVSAVAEWLAAEQKNVVILCSGWKNKFCLEDTLFAGHSRRDCWAQACSDPIVIRPMRRWTCGMWPKAMCRATSRRLLSATA